MVTHVLLLLQRFPRLILFAAAALPLAGAYIAEYGFGYMPCHLCLYQRIPYALILLLALAARWLNQKQWIQILLPLILLLFLSEAGIALYHSGVELHWWQGLEGCNSSSTATSIDELRNEIFATASVPCDIIALSFLGLSMANWNVVYALTLAYVVFLMYRKSRITKRTKK